MNQIIHPIIKALKYLHPPVYKLRLQSLQQSIMPMLRAGDQVLDVGCGSGALGRSIEYSSECPPRVHVTGLEIFSRGEELTDIKFYDGQTIPYTDKSYDVVILADVLHHASDPPNLICECARVARRVLIIKDHKIDGFLSQQRISLMDWASNVQYGVPCLYRYNTLNEWKKLIGQLNLEIEIEFDSMKIYPAIMDLFFGGRIQFMAVLRPNGNGCHGLKPVN